ncbi:MAG: GGDEF domain-containing protein [Spirochaetales bacterium]|nr:GGDEF domain-containing protein [Spirochaetales bacterium]
MVERFLAADLCLFLFFVLSMITLLLWQKKGTCSYKERLFMGLCLSTMAMLILDVIFRFTDGGPSRPLIYLVTWLYFLVEPIPMTLWLCYLDYYLYNSRERLRKRLYYSPFFLIILVFLVVSFFNGAVFSIDGENFYRRGPFVPLIVSFNIIILLGTIIIALRRKRDVGQRVFQALVLFSLIPLLGNLLQFFFDGTILIWPTVAVAVTYAFLFLEFQREQKDYLTGLLNRQQIDDIIHNRISQLERRGGFTLVMVDMDDFKLINDEYGHKEGDRALVLISELIYSSVRAVDRVARFGGDEFVILLEEEDQGEVEKVLSRLKELVDSEKRNRSYPYKLDLSCGYKIILPGETRGYYDLVHEADQEMYRIKRAKKSVS